MSRRFLTGLALCLTLLVPHGGIATAQGSDLQRLDTGDEGRGWEAVGRLDIDGRGFCTGALIAEDLVLTAAHCLYDRKDGSRVDPTRIEFLAGWRNGRASAYRQVRRAVVPPGYDFSSEVTPGRVSNDLALLELYQPVRNTRVIPFRTDEGPGLGDRIAVVSYAHNRAEAPSLQEICDVITRQEGALVMSCDVDFGSSGAPVFTFADGGEPRIVSVVSAKAEVQGRNVSLGTDLSQLHFLLAEMDAGQGHGLPDAPRTNRITVGSRSDIGAKFVRPGQ